MGDGPELKKELALLLFVLMFANILALPAVIAAPSPPQAIKHVVVIMQENHTFDNYFGTYPTANGINGSNVVVQQSLNSAEPVKPFHIPGSEVSRDLDHSWAVAHDAYNSGRMDRFVVAEGSNLTMGYFDYHQIPYYWDYASQFVLLDNYFSSVMGPSLPNHLYLLAGQSGTLTGNARYGQLDFTSKNIHNGTFEFSSVVDELDAKHVSWKYYAGGYQSLNNWNPLPAFASLKHNSTKLSNIAATEQFPFDVANKNLASVSWVMPKADELSEHPPYNVTAGQVETVSLINSIMQSSYWNSTAIFLTWDDYGGWYDHVPPPQGAERGAGTYGYGFRVPCLIISPFAMHSFVDSTQADHTSILKFIETIFSLPSLASRDAAANNLLGVFDFSQTPRPPLILPGPFTPNHYPLKPLTNASLVPIKTPTKDNHLPNLTVDKVVLRPAHPKLGEMVRVNFTLKNIGTGEATGVTTSLYLNDTSHSYQHLETSGPVDLKGGELRSLAFSTKIPATLGSHSIFVVVDDTNSIPETQVDNNALIRMFSVAPASPLLPERTSTASTTTTTVSATVTVPTFLTQTTSITSTSFQTQTSTVTETVTTTISQPNNSIYGGALALVAAIVVVTFAVAKGARAVKTVDG